jgi:hypothetical protein
MEKLEIFSTDRWIGGAGLIGFEVTGDLLLEIDIELHSEDELVLSGVLRER